VTVLPPLVAHRPATRPGAATLALVGRGLRRLPRQPDALILSVVLPITLLLMFVYVFGGALGAWSGSRHAYLTYVVPGIIVLAAGWGAASTAVTVATDLAGGLVDRLRSLPIRATAVLTGDVVGSLAGNAVATALVIGIAVGLGYRPRAGAAGWLAALGVLALYVLAITWLATALGLLAGGPEAANGITFGILFLPYVSSGFAPTATMPGPLRAFADHQPLTPVIDTLRGLLSGGGVAPRTAALAVTWCVGILVVSYAGAAVAFRHRARR
jgi:ABC-2 type transport system permease protein